MSGVAEIIDPSGVIEIDGGSLVRVSKINAVIMPGDMSGGDGDRAALVFGLHTIMVSVETGAEAKRRMLAPPSFGAEQVADEATGRKIVRMSPEEFGERNRRMAALEAENDRQHLEGVSRDREIALQRRRLRWLHEKLMQTDIDAAPLYSAESRRDLEAAIDKAMEAEGSVG